jgi:hypothetical protein
VAADLTIEVKKRVEDSGKSPSRHLVVSRERRYEPVTATFHQTSHHLPELRAFRVHAVDLVEGLGRAAFEHVIEQRVEQAWICNP